MYQRKGPKPIHFCLAVGRSCSLAVEAMGSNPLGVLGLISCLSILCRVSLIQVPAIKQKKFATKLSLVKTLLHRWEARSKTSLIGAKKSAISFLLSGTAGLKPTTLKSLQQTKNLQSRMLPKQTFYFIKSTNVTIL